MTKSMLINAKGFDKSQGRYSGVYNHNFHQVKDYTIHAMLYIPHTLAQPKTQNLFQLENFQAILDFS